MTFGLEAWDANGNILFGSDRNNMFILHEETISAGAEPDIFIDTPLWIFPNITPNYSGQQLGDIFHEVTWYVVNSNRIRVECRYPTLDSPGSQTKRSSILICYTEYSLHTV